ncbi:hypothetical protein L3Y34_019353 [Caenorhabditis briggsae]|uniref:Uncharacterized protein n=1 Tax=Caenorhabditis briggsae TaxID=6238 RepID=A0AAE9DPQ8_CAEBR|nr:hypothetical protein L3Y34_019353 [Caenorhabditis briggsae]
MMDPTVFAVLDTTNSNFSENFYSMDSEVFKPSTSDFEEDEDTYSEISDFSDFDFPDSEEDDDAQTLEEIQKEIDEEFERLLKEMDQMDAEIQGLRQSLV